MHSDIALGYDRVPENVFGISESPGKVLEFFSSQGRWNREYCSCDAVNVAGADVTYSKTRGTTSSQAAKYVVNFDIKDLKTFRRSRPSLGWSYLIFILKCGTTFPALHFHHGGTKRVIQELRKHLHIKT